MKLHFFGGGAGESILLEGLGGWGMVDCLVVGCRPWNDSKPKAPVDWRAFRSNLFPNLNLAVLKVCHHGSSRDNPARILDRLGVGPADLAVVTRYAPSRLPSARVMVDLRRRSQKLEQCRHRLEALSKEERAELSAFVRSESTWMAKLAPDHQVLRGALIYALESGTCRAFQQLQIQS